MKKYFGPGFLLLSILVTFLMILNKPSAMVEEKKVNVPYVKTMMLLPQTVSAQIASQGFIKPKNKLNNAFDSIAFQDFLNKASVDFGKSNTQKDSCKTYFINGYWDEKPISIRLENCEKSVEVIQLNYRSE